MNKKIFSLLILLSSTAIANFSDSFPNVTDHIYLPSEHIKINYDPSIVVLLDKPHPKRKEYLDSGVYISRPLKFKFTNSDSLWTVVDCDSGGSADPSCTFYQEKNNGDLIQLGNIAGSNFILTGNSNIYTTGIQNQFFSKTDKYTLAHSRLVAVKQPFYSVNLKTKTRDPIVIYADTLLQKHVANIARGSSVNVLINNGDFYLVESPTGLTGWYKLDSSVSKDTTPLEDLYMHGD